MLLKTLRIACLSLLVAACAQESDDVEPMDESTAVEDGEPGAPDGPAEDEVDPAEDPGEQPAAPSDGPSYGQLNPEILQEFAATPPEEDGPFYMVNLIRYRELAVYPDGRETDLTGREANDLYAPIEFLMAIGAAPVFVGEVEQQLLGDETVWESFAIVRYPSRALFLQMTSDPAFMERAIHKDAGLESSIVMVTEPLDTPDNSALIPDEVAYPATEQDPAFDMVHVMNYHDVAQYEDGVDEPERSGREAVGLYSQSAGMVATPLGVQPVLWLEVKGVLIGDGRDWHEVRINRFPSHAAFDALTSDATWMSGTYHRAAGLQDTYSLQVLSSFDSL